MMKGNTNIESFIKVFDNRLNKYLDEKEEDLRDPIERMINHWRMLIMKWKSKKYDGLKSNHNQYVQE